MTDDLDVKILAALKKAQEATNASKGVRDVWREACKLSNDVLDLYDGGYDKKELGKKPDFELLRKVLFDHLLRVREAGSS